MSRHLFYLPTAESDLAGIYDLIARDSPVAALKFVADIRKRCEPLAGFPRMGRPLDDRIVGIRYLGRNWP